MEEQFSCSSALQHFFNFTQNLRRQLSLWRSSGSAHACYSCAHLNRLGERTSSCLGRNGDGIVRVCRYAFCYFSWVDELNLFFYPSHEIRTDTNLSVASLLVAKTYFLDDSALLTAVKSRSLDWPQLEELSRRHVFKPGSLLDTLWSSLRGKTEPTGYIINTFCSEGGDSLPDAARLAALAGDFLDVIDLSSRTCCSHSLFLYLFMFFPAHWLGFPCFCFVSFFCSSLTFFRFSRTERGGWQQPASWVALGGAAVERNPLF